MQAKLGLGANERAISNVVMMGMGEPLQNYSQLVPALRMMLDDHGYGLSRRRVTVSTSGVVPMIDRLREDCPVALAVSLHAPDDALRDQLVPINKKYPIDELLAACERYLDAAPRDFITMEYCMLDGVNDTPAQAKALVNLVKNRLPVKFNLIPFNPFPESGLKRSSERARARLRRGAARGRPRHHHPQDARRRHRRRLWSTRGRGAGSHRRPTPHDALDPDRRGRAVHPEHVRRPSNPSSSESPSHASRPRASQSDALDEGRARGGGRWLVGLAGCVTTGGAAAAPATATPATTTSRRRPTRPTPTACPTRAWSSPQAYLGRGQPTDALDQVKQALQAKPDNPAAYGLRGLIYASLGDTEKADESFRRAMQLAPHDADLMHNYGWYLCQQRRFDEADAQFKRAIAEPAYRSVPRTMLVARHLPGARRQDARTPRRRCRAPTSSIRPTRRSPSTWPRCCTATAQYERARFYIRRVNNNQELASAQTLWLAARIEHKLGQEQQVKAMGAQLRNRFPQSPEALLFEKGKFDE